MTRRPSVGIIGPGRAGLGLALALRRAGVRVIGVHGRHRKPVPRGVRLTTGRRIPWLAEPDVVLLAVRDDALPRLVRDLAALAGLRRGQVVLHLSGALTAAVLEPVARRGVRVGGMHPLMTLPADARLAAQHLEAAAWAVEGDRAAARAARHLVRAMGGAVVAVDPEHKALYHAGAVFAANYLVTLLAAAARLLTAAGVAAEEAIPALAPLSGASLTNVAVLGPRRALTGPIARGDAATVRRHLAVLPADLRPLYRGLGRATLALVEDELPTASIRALRAALRG